jgi:hypothetical protein
LLYLLSFGPSRRQDFGDLAVGHVGRTTQHVAKVSQIVQTTPAAALDNGVNNGAALTGSRDDNRWIWISSVSCNRPISIFAAVGKEPDFISRVIYRI